MPKKTPRPMSRWAQLKAEAKKNYIAPDPYIFDGADPPVEISAPDSLERSLALATLLDAAGSVAVRDLEAMIAALVGRAAYPAVWDAIRDEPVEVTLALVQDIQRHFDAAPDESAADLPGGAQDS
ncbi:hypothetical protein [Nocardia puris]|uniref:Tail assembly chaperone n=1 Tax=Nocardia puris TaxID=208602 RepID=A0A366DD48_9NOCA|nr:hypothetical protein [Nocardia puris]RBO87963.1 hypothetical protein DFR74_110219 [Nocardia puris]